jgi:lysophospholipase L1-like esterase
MNMSRLLSSIAASSLSIASIAAAAAAEPGPLRFDFGSGPVAAGTVGVPADLHYHAERGYGFEPGTVIRELDRGGDDALRRDFVTADRPFHFSVAVPEGVYDVVVHFGDPSGGSVSTVKAETRRLMVERVETMDGALTSRTFPVHVRRPAIATGGAVRLKDREKGALHWDEKLTLEFSNRSPAISAVEIIPGSSATRLFLLGDSTVCDQSGEPYNSWGQMLPRFFGPGVVVANYAESGESLRSSRSARRLDKALSEMRPGDYVFIQFGHNDMKESGEGIGAFTSFKADLKAYVAAVRAKGAVVAVVTPVQRRNFNAEGRINNTHGDYPAAVRQVAAEESVALIDLHAMSALLYEALGPEQSLKAFAPRDGTHHNNYGSYQVARCVVEGIRAAALPLADLLAADAGQYDPRQPDPVDDFSVPVSVAFESAKPDGS